MLAHFSKQWLDITNLGIAPKDAETYPEFSDLIRDAMLEETARFSVRLPRGQGLPVYRGDSGDYGIGVW